jgi:hypothetical protein
VKRLAILLLMASTSAAAQPAPAPDWTGVWIDTALEVDVSGIPVGGPERGGENPYRLLGLEAPWNADGKIRFDTMLKKIQAGQGKSNGWGFPMMMDSPAPFEIVFAPDRALIYNIYRELRVVYTDGRPHPPADDLWPTTWGDSIGHWEGDTLVIDTISVRNPSESVDFAPPLSEEAHYVERLRLTAPGTIQSDITIEDPVTLTGPWTVKRTYKRLDVPDRVVLDSISNDRTGSEDGVFTIEAEAAETED